LWRENKWIFFKKKKRPPPNVIKINFTPPPPKGIKIKKYKKIILPPALYGCETW